MGGGPANPISIDNNQDDIQPLNTQIQSISLNKETALDGANATNAIKINDEDGDLKMEDVDEEPAPPKGEKAQLKKELKALGIKPGLRPDYTVPLSEPSWGDSDEEDGEDEEVEDEDDEEREGVLDGEDVDFEEDEDDMDDVEAERREL